MSYANELTGWHDNGKTYYYNPGNGKWENKDGAEVMGTVRFLAGGTYQATGNAAPPAAGTWTRVN